MLVMHFLIVFFFHCGHCSWILSQICHVFRHFKTINYTTVHLKGFHKRTRLVLTDLRLVLWSLVFQPGSRRVIHFLPQTYYVPKVLLYWEKLMFFFFKLKLQRLQIYKVCVQLSVNTVVHVGEYVSMFYCSTINVFWLWPSLNLIL